MPAETEKQTPMRPPGWLRPLDPPECPEGWRTGPPDFVGIGAQRSGTGWWYGGALRSHPQVATAPDRRKELHFFDRYWVSDPEPDMAAQYALHFPRPEGTIAGEWTPRYMHDPWAVPLLAEAAPEARILVLLRDPVERYRSGVGHEVERSKRRGQDPPNVAIVGDSIGRGLYHLQVGRAIELFGHDQVLVLQYERCVADPLTEMQRTQRFLGLEPLEEVPGRMLRRKASAPKPQVPDRLWAELRRYFADDVRRLAELDIGIDPGLWPNFADL